MVSKIYAAAGGAGKGSASPHVTLFPYKQAHSGSIHSVGIL